MLVLLETDVIKVGFFVLNRFLKWVLFLKTSFRSSIIYENSEVTKDIFI